MAGPVTVQVLGVDKVVQTLMNKNQRVKSEVSSALQDSVAPYLVKEVKASINGERDEHRSYKTGDFMKSVHSRNIGKFEVSIEDGVPYGVYVEYAPYIVGGPRRHFQNTLDRERKEINNIVLKNVKRGIAGGQGLALLTKGIRKIGGMI